MFRKLCLIACLTPLQLWGVHLGIGYNRILKVPGIVRAAVGNSKVVKVKAVPPSQLILTGKKAGRTVVRVWDSDGEIHSYSIVVLDPELLNRPGHHASVVHVSLQFLEMDRNQSRQLGIRWPEVFQVLPRAHIYGGQQTTGLNYSAGILSSKGLIHLMLDKGWASLLASPDLYVRLGEEAKFHSGGEYPIRTTRGSYGSAFQHVEWKPYGMSLKVRPRSGDGLYIHSEIWVEISELNVGFGSDEVPALTRRTIDTKMISMDGETVILSGLVRQSIAEKSLGVPILSEIPLIGELFKSRRKENRKTEILLALTLEFAGRGQSERVDRLLGEINETQ